jgi:hypothetical protein
VAVNSAVVMPLGTCCLTEVARADRSLDIEGRLCFCPKCGTHLEFKDRAWRTTKFERWEGWRAFYDAMTNE